MKQRILVVEDEESIALPLTDRLLRAGYDVEIASDGNMALDRALHGDFRLILLDLQLPGKSGLDVCRDLRQRSIDTPILMLTAFGETTDKVVGLKLGADDYLAKPFDPAELLARIEALLRRARSASARVFHFAGIHVDLDSATVKKDGVPVVLTAREFQLLSYFAARPGQLVSREQLLADVWGYGAAIHTRTVDVHVGWLRQKLEADPKNPLLFVTRIGLGYIFQPPEESS